MSTESPNKTRRWLNTTIAALGATRAFAGASFRATFPIFDALAHRVKPNLLRLGLQPLTWVGNIWRAGIAHDRLDEEGILLALKQLPRGTQTFYLDIEDWPVLKQSPVTRAQNIQKLLRVADLARGHMPGAQFGFYGLPPAITYWPLVNDSPSEYADWVESNQLLEPLADRVDFIFPSLYTFYRDQNGWLKYATATIKAARRYGKPVYPFLWYEYHDSNPLLRNHEIDLDAWTRELRFCHEMADGLVLWGGWERGWSGSAAWWQAVRQEFGLQA